MTQPADPGENAPLDFPTRSEGPEPARCPETPPPPAAPGDQNTPVVEGSTAVPLTRADEGGGDLLTLSGGDVPTGEGGGPREPAGEIPAGGPAVPGYEICRELGRGGMGVVYLARQIGLDRLVALKMILAGSHASQEDLVRFRAEAEAAARLQHPNIVQVYEVGQAHGLPYFSLELCTGGSLEKKLARTPWPARKAAQLVELLARAVHCAHQRQVVHRDLKPANVLLTEDGTPKITDFGLAKRLDAVGQTRSGALMGTPSYMAPEQAQGRSREVGSHTDVYALGALLYECLTGRPPFLAETSLDTVLQVIQDEPVPPTRLAPSCPRDLETGVPGGAAGPGATDGAARAELALVPAQPGRRRAARRGSPLADRRHRHRDRLCHRGQAPRRRGRGGCRPCGGKQGPGPGERSAGAAREAPCRPGGDGGP